MEEKKIKMDLETFNVEHSFRETTVIIPLEPSSYSNGEIDEASIRIRFGQVEHGACGIVPGRIDGFHGG